MTSNIIVQNWLFTGTRIRKNLSWVKKVLYKDAKFNSEKNFFSWNFAKNSKNWKNFVLGSPTRHVNRFAWNYGCVYSSTWAMTWGTFPLPVGTSKPEVGYFAMKPTIFRYQILPWVIKKWFRVDWVTFRYSWNRKYW